MLQANFHNNFGDRMEGYREPDPARGPLFAYTCIYCWRSCKYIGTFTFLVDFNEFEAIWW
jgi:hypothetical protein